ncbi:CZB domain-containing protein [Aliikangiella maris]|uniref:CZB domain-containing protein n=2 Tax=Aliikangiella maris TaxID=3162458 RepID=A0ABV3MKZ9_9GAMM
MVIVWKEEVYAIAFGVIHKPVDEFADHTLCRLGKWYQTEGKQKYTNINVFRLLDDPHRAVHQNGIQALRLIQDQQLESAIHHLNEMEKASVRVMELLDELSLQIDGRT